MNSTAGGTKNVYNSYKRRSRRNDQGQSWVSSKKEAKEILEITLEDIKFKLEQGEDVKISGFGKWNVKEKRSRPGRNPHTGEKIEISSRKVVTFHPSDKMRDSVNKSTPANT